MSDLGFIHRYIPAPGESARVFLLLHGTGGNENDMLSLGRELDPNAAILSPRGNVSENGAPRFFRRLAEGVFDEEDVVFRANELADFIAAAAKHYQFKLQEMIAVGYSNGANISTAVMLVRPEALHAAILLRAMVPLTNPAQTNLSGKRVLISNGEHDPIVPMENTHRLVSLFKTRSAAVTLESHQAGHGLVGQDLSVAKHWLGR